MTLRVFTVVLYKQGSVVKQIDSEFKIMSFYKPAGAITEISQALRNKDLQIQFLIDGHTYDSFKYLENAEELSNLHYEILLRAGNSYRNYKGW